MLMKLINYYHILTTPLNTKQTFIFNFWGNIDILHAVNNTHAPPKFLN